MVLILLDGKDFVPSVTNTVKLMKIVKDAKDSKTELSIYLSDIDLVDNKDHLDHMVKTINTLTTTEKSIDVLIKENLKGREADASLVVLSMDDKEMDVNPNNNSHYIFMDSYITTRVYSLVKPHIVKNNTEEKEEDYE